MRLGRHIRDAQRMSPYNFGDSLILRFKVFTYPEKHLPWIVTQLTAMVPLLSKVSHNYWMYFHETSYSRDLDLPLSFSV